MCRDWVAVGHMSCDLCVCVWGQAVVREVVQSIFPAKNTAETRYAYCLHQDTSDTTHLSVDGTCSMVIDMPRRHRKLSRDTGGLKSPDVLRHGWLPFFVRAIIFAWQVLRARAGRRGTWRTHSPCSHANNDPRFHHLTASKDQRFDTNTLCPRCVADPLLRQVAPGGPMSLLSRQTAGPVMQASH